MSNLAATFGANLRAERERRGLTQVGLADLAGCSEEWIRRVERGAAKPSLDFLENVGAVLGVSPASLLTAPRSDEANQLLADEVAGMQPDERTWLKAMITAMRQRPGRKLP